MVAIKKNISSRKKKLKASYSANQRQWVGDGFYVHGLLRPSEELNEYISPFILMDYASPKKFTKTNQRRGVGEHPHRGFETVTLAYQGEIEHRDSAGGGGIIKSGDVQWMTAGKGVVHDEFHSAHFSKAGGMFEMVQLWVNLPKKHKMTSPKYQGIESHSIPKIKLGNHSELRVIAGEFEGTKGPATTYSPIQMYDITSFDKGEVLLKLKEGTNTILLIMSGELELEDEIYEQKNILIFDRGGEYIDFKISRDFKGLVLNGEPLKEPIVAHGPFVMNTREEISEAIRDYQNGKMGSL